MIHSLRFACQVYKFRSRETHGGFSARVVLHRLAEHMPNRRRACRDATNTGYQIRSGRLRARHFFSRAIMLVLPPPVIRNPSRASGAPHPPVFAQVFISMGLGLTIGASCASGGFVAVFAGEEKTPSGQSEAQSAISSTAGDTRGRREAEVWFRANMYNYNHEVLSRQLVFTI